MVATWLLKERRKSMFTTGAMMKAVPIAAVLAGLSAAIAFAGPIEDRQALMKSNGKEIGALAKMFKGEDPYDAAAVKAHADKIAANLEKVVTLFPEDNKQGPPETWAKTEIWSDMAGFKAAADNAYKAAEAVADTKDEAGFKAAMPALGEACGGCHKKYRRPKD
jgi:cytochrome c556